MKVSRRLAAAMAVTVSFCVSQLHAQDNTTAMPGITSGSESSLTSRVRERIYADFGTTYHGPTLSKFGPYSQNAIGQVDPGAMSGFDSELNAAYIIDSVRQLGVGPDIGFFYQPNIQGKEFQMQDVGLKAFYKNTIVTEHFHLYTNAFVQAPTSEYARDHHMAFALRTSPFAIYDIGQTRWRIGTWTDLRYLAAVSSDVTFKAYVQPYVAYRLTDKFMLNVAYETEAHHDVGEAGLKFHSVLSDFQPGVVWQVGQKTKLTAYLLLFPKQPLSSETTGIGATLYTQLL